MEAEGKRIGVTSGRTIDYLNGRMVSLAALDTAYADEGGEVEIVWGHAEQGRVRIRAVVAPLPYYRGEFRNETFDTARIPRP